MMKPSVYTRGSQRKPNLHQRLCECAPHSVRTARRRYAASAMAMTMRCAPLLIQSAAKSAGREGGIRLTGAHRGSTICESRNNQRGGCQTP
eukprot:3458866-Amphidinium_carterae.1